MKYRRPEKEFQSDLIAKFRAGGAMVLNVHGHGMQAPGWPDIQVYQFCKVLQLELKVGEGKATTAQSIIIAQLRGRGIAACVAREIWGDIQLEDGNGKVIGRITRWEGFVRIALFHEILKSI